MRREPVGPWRPAAAAQLLIAWCRSAGLMLYSITIAREDPVSEIQSRAETDLAGLDSHVGYMLRRAQLAVFGDFIACQRGAVARPGQFSILALIDRNPGLSQSQVCSALGIKRANLVAVIDELESAGLVRRDASAKDRRSNHLHLTPAGQRALRSAQGGQEEHEARIARLLGANGRRSLLKQLAKLGQLRSFESKA
jgi:DNA-binding MarR family transcriptional regulator